MKKEDDDSPSEKNKGLVETESIILLRNQIENMSDTEQIDNIHKISLDPEMAILEGTDV